MSTRIERGETETTSADLGVAPLWRRATGRLGDLGLWVVLVLVLSMVTGSDAPEGERSYPVWLYPSLAVLPIIYEAVAVRWRKGQTCRTSFSMRRIWRGLITRAATRSAWKATGSGVSRCRAMMATGWRIASI